MYGLRGVKTLTLVKNVGRYTLIEICCVAGLCRVVVMSYFLGNDATSVNAFYFVVYIAVIVLTDVKNYGLWVSLLRKASHY
jgi:hypothetical protein